MEDLIKESQILFQNIDKYNHRGLYVISGNNIDEIIKIIFNKYNEYFNEKINNKDILIVSYNPERIEKYLEKTINYLKNELYYNIEFEKYENTQKILGRSYQILIMDLYEDINPDYLGRLFGVVNGRGIIILLLKDFNNLENIKTKFREHLITPPYTISDVKNNFEKRLKNKILQYENIIVYDTEKGLLNRLKVRDYENIDEGYKIYVEKETKFPLRLYKLCLTQDQVNVLKNIEKIFDYDNVSYVLTADRGRGKSAVLGLSIAGIIYVLLEKNRRYKIGISSLYRDNIDVLWEFIKKGLEYNGIKYIENKKRNKIIVNKKIIIEYRQPVDLLNNDYYIVFVDEAAAVPVNILYKISDKYNKTIFSTTIHGYEGTGRSFSVKFMKYLKKKENTHIIELKMKTPIRYYDNDPIENFINDTLLLDAESAVIDSEDLKLIEEKKFNFYQVPIEKWTEEDNIKMKEFIGIYVLAHYQNRPSDYAMLLDAPHHMAFALELQNGKIVNGIHVAREGKIVDEGTINKMLKDFKPKGNIIPDVIVKHYRNKDFPKYYGLRIVRIATHFELQDKGLGSEALKRLEDWAKKNNYDWIGSSFGVNYELLNFWQKNGFYIIHLSPNKNKVSGEYSGIVIKPLNDDIYKIIEKLSYEFRWKLLTQVTDVYFDLEPKLVRKLLDSDIEYKPHINNLLTEVEIEKLEAYLSGPMTYEAASDSIKNLYIYYKLNNPKDLKLDNLEEEIIISKVLLAWSFRKIQRYFDIKPMKIRRIIRNITKKLYNFYFK